jgi:hypothetical protein
MWLLQARSSSVKVSTSSPSLTTSVTNERKTRLDLSLNLSVEAGLDLRAHPLGLRLSPEFSSLISSSALGSYPLARAEFSSPPTKGAVQIPMYGKDQEKSAWHWRPQLSSKAYINIYISILDG